MKELIKQSIDKYYDEVKAIATSIYENPEIANEEVNSTKIIVELLKKHGYEVEENLVSLPTAFSATKKNGDGPKIAIPIEYDALPEIGHACGHHMIAGMSLLGGMALADVLSKYNGTVTLFGTPAEETGEGKPPIVDAGLIDDYDCGMMLHPFSRNIVNPVVTSIGVYDITFTGKTSHAGAAPSEGVNALDAVVQMYNAVSMMRQQMKDGTRLEAIVLKGGAMINSIPDHCVIRYETRTLTMEYYDHVVERLENCAKAAALATGCTVDFRLSMPICSAMSASPALDKAYRALLADAGITPDEGRGEPIATDMGEFDTVIPSIHPMVQLSDNNEKLHTKEFLEALNMPYAWDKMKEHATILAYLGLEVFENEELLKELRAEREIKRARRAKKK